MENELQLEKQDTCVKSRYFQ